MDLIEFEWQRCPDGFQLRHWHPANPEGWSEEGVFLIAAESDRFVPYRPTDYPALFQRFADAPPSPEGMRDFANDFGFLRTNMPAGFGDYQTWLVEGLLKDHDALRAAISLFDTGKTEALSQEFSDRKGLVRTKLWREPSGKLSLVFVPETLLDFLWLQFGLHVVSGAKLLRCKKCGLPFPTGSGTGRRDTAMFCSNRCKVASFRAQKAATSA